MIEQETNAHLKFDVDTFLNIAFYIAQALQRRKQHIHRHLVMGHTNKTGANNWYVNN